MLKITPPVSLLTVFWCLLFLVTPIYADSNPERESGSIESNVDGVSASPEVEQSGSSLLKSTEGDPVQGIQFKKDNSIGVSYVLKILFSLFFVLVVAYLVILFVKKMNTGWLISKGIQGENIKLVEQKRITPRLSVYVLSVGEEKILMAQCGEHVSFYPEAVKIPEISDQRSADVQKQQ